MRSLKFGGLFLLAGALSFACNGGDDEGPGGTGGSAATGGTSGGTGGTGAGGETTGGGNPACDNTVVASGVPAMIDDFDHGTSWNFAADADGRIGTWEWEWNDGESGREFGPPLEGKTGMLGMGGGGNLTPEFLEIKCETDGHCTNTDYKGWGNYAAVATRLTQWSDSEVNCYDASVFTGISFKAKSPNNDKLGIQAVDPAADPEQGYVYKGNDGGSFSLTSEWVEYKVPFDTFKIPSWVADAGGPSGAIDPKALISISFTVRTVGGDGTTYEYVKPYDIQIDDVAFYK